jgi:hypothetical protein
MQMEREKIKGIPHTNEFTHYAGSGTTTAATPFFGSNMDGTVTTCSGTGKVSSYTASDLAAIGAGNATE